MERSSVIGLAAGMILIAGTIFIGGGWQTFLDVPSMILVIGGTFAALMVGFSFSELKASLAITKAFFTFRPPDLRQYVGLLTDLARVARRDGLLALDRRIAYLEDPFIRTGLEMAVDGMDGPSIAAVLDQQITQEMQQRQLGTRFYNTAGTYAPAFGMIGTLIGLIQMLQNLSDPTQIGAGMAVALITTFYGALLANLIFLPIAGKIKAQAALVLTEREMIRTGVLAIVEGEAPGMIEKRLKLFLGEAEGTAEAAPAAEPALAMAA